MDFVVFAILLTIMLAVGFGATCWVMRELDTGWQVGLHLEASDYDKNPDNEDTEELPNIQKLELLDARMSALAHLAPEDLAEHLYLEDCEGDPGDALDHPIAVWASGVTGDPDIEYALGSLLVDGRYLPVPQNFWLMDMDIRMHERHQHLRRKRRVVTEELVSQ
jgi:hypothetical protein